MRRSPINVASVILSGLMATGVCTGLYQPSAQASDPSPAQPAKAKPSPSPSKPGTAAASKNRKSAIEPIEPFIQADVVALGQWLVTKKVKKLVAAQPSTEKKASTETPKADPAKRPSAKPASAAATPAATPRATKKAAAPAQPPAQKPSNTQTATLPPVAVQALPPEPSANPTIDGYTEMRVALTKQAANVNIAASSGGSIISTNGDFIENVAANVSYQVSADANGLFINGKPVPTAVWLDPQDGYVAVGNRWYRGRLLLLWQNGGVMAVNHVLLSDYLYSVVGAEMSASWSIEALKAQAVAARSYAIVHTVRHQRRAYDLDDTQRYQAYKGIATEATSTQRAVHETAGEFISYGGGVVESLYAANQEIVDDAHSGYGMSQTGALDLAEQGYQYYEILSAYYPDTSVGRIDVGD